MFLHGIQALIICLDYSDRQRNETIERMMKSLHDLLEKLSVGVNMCSFRCKSMLVGVLTLQMLDEGFFPLPRSPFLDFSVTGVADSIRDIQSPQWCCNETKLHYYYGNHDEYCQEHHCHLKEFIDPIVQYLPDNIYGLSLESFE